MVAEKTKVIFRKFKSGDIIALFPEIPADMTAYNCLSYMSFGQHGAASPSLVNDTKSATPDEYKDLYKELTKIGYNLTVIKRFRHSHFEVRKSTYK